MKKKKYEEIVNVEVELDIEALPTTLRNYVKEIENYAKEGDWSMVYGSIDGVCNMAKNAYAHRRISKSVWDAIELRYNGERYEDD